MDEVRVLHVLCQTLQEAEGLVEDNRHGYLRQLLREGETDRERERERERERRGEGVER